MNKTRTHHITRVILTGIFLITSLISNVGVVNATVGGGSYIHSFKYNPKDESVYFIRNDMGGRGCPPELIKISLNTGKEEVVLSCDIGEKLGSNSSYNQSEEINKLTTSFKDLTPINLNANQIAIDVKFLNTENYSAEIDEILRSHFTGAVYQGDKKITDIAISGCNEEQPFIFAGYAIPGFDKKIMLLLSTKGDCFEGGYIHETLYVVGGVDNLNKDFYTNFYKDSSPLVPNEGTLIVNESDIFEDERTDNISIRDETVNKKAASPSLVLLIVISLVAIIAGVVLGRLTKQPKNI